MVTTTLADAALESHIVTHRLTRILKYTPRLAAALRSSFHKSGGVLSLKQYSSNTFALLFNEDLEVLVYDSDCQKYASSTADCTHEVGEYRERADTKAAERRGGRDVSVQLVNHRRVAVTSHDHLLLLQLLGHIFSARARHVNPRLREEGAGAEHEDDVENGVDRVLDHVR